MAKTRGFQEIIQPTRISLAIRFRIGDLRYAKFIAKKQEKKYSTWMRELAMDRAKKVLQKQSTKLELLEYQTADGKGKSVCIGFTEKDFLYIRRAAITEGALPSPWIRACVMVELRKELTWKDSKHDFT